MPEDKKKAAKAAKAARREAQLLLEAQSASRIAAVVRGRRGRELSERMRVAKYEQQHDPEFVLSQARDAWRADRREARQPGYISKIMARTLCVPLSSANNSGACSAITIIQEHALIEVFLRVKVVGNGLQDLHAQLTLFMF